ncbi:MAG: YdcF family protein [[Clostridium] aminophilum]|uniref:YdcF family protein n=1 Tax=[Clostridium] aminophilum TaxID=1526 RepID=UPI0026EB5553|nr:YdcF family protein [[Clostridium] aminophilum]MDD6196823.1 YdcF family protein [[Clostridium] aminophilum]
MIRIFELISAGCLIYAAILALYSGLTTSFFVFWPLMSILFAGLSLWVRYTQTNPVELQVKVRVITIMAAAAAIFLAAEAVILIGLFRADERFGPEDKKPEYCIVLGAGLKDGKPSVSLERRLERAYEYLQENPGVILVLSGGKGKDEIIPEAEAMRVWMKEHHVPEYCYLIENRSENTVQNIECSLAVIRKHVESKTLVPVRVTLRSSVEDGPPEERAMPEEREAEPYRLPPTAVLTSDFHVYRALKIFQRTAGVTCAGISAKTDPVMMLHLWVREGVALLKDKFVGNI